MREFERFHPIVNLIYFVLVIGFSMILMNPVCIAISFIAGIIYTAMLYGAINAVKKLAVLIPVMFITALINPLFNHGGVTILSYLPGGNPLTLESILFGIAAATILASVIFWFSCFNEIMTSDKIIYISGQIMPSLSLILSMVLRFVPRFKEQFKKISEAQRCVGKNFSDGNIIEKAKHGITILSILITWALENSIETADSMKSRGFGLNKRTSYSIFKLERRDIIAIIYMLFLATYLLTEVFMGKLNFNYFPSFSILLIDIYTICIYFGYAILLLVPVFIELWEVRKWTLLRQKI